jgi:hypothetical protein
LAKTSEDLGTANFNIILNAALLAWRRRAAERRHATDAALKTAACH